jgi:hypothetical protein
VSDAEFVSRIVTAAVGCSVACLVISTVTLVWVARLVVRMNRLEERE